MLKKIFTNGRRSALPALFSLAIPVILSAREDPPLPPVPVLEMAAAKTSLPGTALLAMEGDLSEQLVEGVDRFLLNEIEASTGKRARHWNRDFSSIEKYEASVEENRGRFRRIIGLQDPRVASVGMQFTSRDPKIFEVAGGRKFSVYNVRWPVFRDVHGEGLLLVPDSVPVADVVAIPDADMLPEAVSGLVPGIKSRFQYAQKLAASGCRVLVPALIDRSTTEHHMSYREWLYRPAFELGRHLIGYEVHKILAGVEYLKDSQEGNRRKVGVIGWGEGGLLAFYAAAADQRISAACVSGYFGPRQKVWDEPAYRNVWGLLDEFGDAEIATLITPRALIVENAPGPEVVVAPAIYDAENRRPVNQGSPVGKPGSITTPAKAAVRGEAERAHELLAGLAPGWSIDLVASDDPISKEGLEGFLGALGVDESHLVDDPGGVEMRGEMEDTAARHLRQVHEIVEHNEWALRESPYMREAFMKDLKTDSLEAFEKTVEPYRKIFREDVVGHFDRPLLDPNPRSRRYQVGEGVTSYEVVLDVFPDVIAYGILTVPDAIKKGEKRPVVVCQHGLEGRPQDVVGEEGFKAYKAFATRLAQRGFITFAPQNLYLGQDKFRTLQFKGNSIKKTLFSVIVPQHQQIVDWLSGLDFVDAERIAFYGLSYGGKSAMRIPPLVPNYCLSICSADFNEWVWKNCSTRSTYSYAQKREYEIFEWNLGGTFNYAEMAMLIAPRPFMVERGHFDGVAPDEMVAHEFAKVRRHYNLLGIGDRAEIEWFIGPHTINGAGTFDFLHRHLNWPKKSR